MKKVILLQKRPDGGDIIFSLSVPPEHVNLSAIIIDCGGLSEKKDLLDFVNQVISKTNKKDEHWTNGYTAQLVEKDGKRMIKVFFRLTDNEKHCIIDPEEFKELIEVWILEEEKFVKDRMKYTKDMLAHGAEVIILEEISKKYPLVNSSTVAFSQYLEELSNIIQSKENGVVAFWTNKQYQELAAPMANIL